MAVDSDYLERARRELWNRECFTFIPDRDLPAPTQSIRPGTGAAVVFAGFPSDYSLAFLLALLRLEVRLSGIVTSPGAHPAILGENALSRIAEHLDIPLLRAWRINDEHSRMSLAAMQPELVVMASFDQIVGTRALAVPAHGWLNAHPSLLPQYRGPEPVYWAIAEGASETGITLHRAVPKVDAGPIMAQAAVPIEADDNAGTLTKRIANRGASVLQEAVDGMLRNLPGRIPDLEHSTYRPSVGHRNLRSAATAAEAARMVRAGFPNMLAWVDVNGTPRYVHRARVLHDGAAPDAPALRFPDGTLELTTLSPTCSCHHDLPDCPHREVVAGAAAS